MSLSFLHRAVGSVYEWQTLIAGAAAIFGGWLAYCAGMRQARATNEAARLQVIENDKAVARGTLVAARMLDASMEVVFDGIETARSRYGAAPGQREVLINVEFIIEAIEKPGFNFS